MKTEFEDRGITLEDSLSSAQLCQEGAYNLFGTDVRISGTTGPLFDATRTADETFSKPHPAMLHELMQELDVDPSRVIMVGDTSHDLQMACNAGVHGLGVTYGAHTLKELEGCAPQAVLDTVPLVREWLMPRVSAGA